MEIILYCFLNMDQTTIPKLNFTKWLNSVNVGGVMVDKLCTLFDHFLHMNQVYGIYRKGFQTY